MEPLKNVFDEIEETSKKIDDRLLQNRIATYKHMLFGYKLFIAILIAGTLVIFAKAWIIFGLLPAIGFGIAFFCFCMLFNHNLRTTLKSFRSRIPEGALETCQK